MRVLCVHAGCVCACVRTCVRVRYVCVCVYILIIFVIGFADVGVDFRKTSCKSAVNQSKTPRFEKALRLVGKRRGVSVVANKNTSLDNITCAYKHAHVHKHRTRIQPHAPTCAHAPACTYSHARTHTYTHAARNHLYQHTCTRTSSLIQTYNLKFKHIL